ncbi:phage DNA ejection protein [Klebsiella aerogenes]|uniref:phage DNA ejection protein n=1 Tax=Klebsiella aerogenes TaxID=548 RepID=UPI00351CBD81
MGLLSKNSGSGSPDFSGFSGGMQQGIKATDSLIKSGERGYDHHRQNMARDAIGKAWASGDPAQLDAAMGAYPEYIAEMQKQMGIRDDQHRKDLGSMTARLHGLLSSGDTEGAKALVQQNANLFDKNGPYSALGIAGMIDSGDKKALQRLDNWAQATTMGSLTPLEIIKEGDAQQRFNLDRQRMAQNYDLGQQRIGLNRERLRHQDIWRNQAHLDRVAVLNRETALQRNFEWIHNLPPELQAQAMKLLPGQAKSGKATPDMFNPNSPDAQVVAGQLLNAASEGQKNNAIFGHRLERDLTTVASMLNAGKISPQSIGAIAKAAGTGDLSNLALNPEEQMYLNAMHDAINAVQRRESGAAISESEWKDAFNRYLPSLGDSKELANQKINLLRGTMKEYQAGAGGIYPAFKYVADQGMLPTASVPTLPAFPPGGKTDVPKDVQDIMKNYPRPNMGG